MAMTFIPLYPASAMTASTDEAVCIVYCTCPDQDSAQRIADALVNQRLAACVNIIPGVQSTYFWKDQVHHDAEVLLMAKTRESRFGALRESILALHPYELPEIIAVPVGAGHLPYLDWVRSST